MYGSYNPSEGGAEDSVVSDFTSTMSNIKQWMNSNRLKVNNSKSELIVFGSKSIIQKCHINQILIDNTPIERSSTIKLLGVTLDQNLTLKQHISNKARSAAYAMHNLRKLRKYLDKNSALKIANSLVFSHMDYANALFVNLPKSTLLPLQRIQNLTAKIILGQSKYSSSTNALKELHILPIHVRAEYKLVVLVYKCLHDLAPVYLKKLIHIRENRYSTRSTSTSACQLYVPFTRLSTFRDRAFSVAGPKFWNALPVEVRECTSLINFKSKLKTYLFVRTFV